MRSFLLVFLTLIPAITFASDPHPAVCKVHVQQGKMPYGLGTGTLVYDDLIITNYHVVENCDKYWVEFPDGETAWCELVKTSKLHDLAALRLDNPVHVKPTGLLSRYMKTGEKLRVCGWTHGEWWDEVAPIEEIKWLWIPNAKGWTSCFTMKARTRGGVSGGPIFARDGRLLAVRNTTGPWNDYTRTGGIVSNVVGNFLWELRR